MEHTKLYQKIAEVSVNWWCNTLASPKFDNGATDHANMMSSMLATTIALKNLPSPEQFAIFREELTKTIIGELEQGRNLVLSVDYTPAPPLYQIAQKANINPMGFPWKTTMLISEFAVAVSYGYNTSYEYLLLTEDGYNKRLEIARKNLEEAEAELEKAIDNDNSFNIECKKAIVNNARHILYETENYTEILYKE